MKRLQDRLRLGSRDSEGRSSFRNKKDKILRKEGYTLLYLGYDMVTGGLDHINMVVADVKKKSRHPETHAANLSWNGLQDIGRGGGVSDMSTGAGVLLCPAQLPGFQ